MNCYYCGMPITNGSTFCQNCGRQVFSPNQNNTGYLTISRPKKFLGCAVAYKVYANGLLLGKVPNGQTVSFPLPYGVHNIFIRCGMGEGMTQITMNEQYPNIALYCPMELGLLKNKINFILIQSN